MSESVKRKGRGKNAPPESMNYVELGAHLGVSRRTLVRYVTTGMVPSPTTVGTRCVWTGEDLVHAMSGPGFPGAFEYTPSARESARARTIAAKKKPASRKRPSPSVRSRKVPASQGVAQ